MGFNFYFCWDQIPAFVFFIFNPFLRLSAPFYSLFHAFPFRSAYIPESYISLYFLSSKYEWIIEIPYEIITLKGISNDFSLDKL